MRFLKRVATARPRRQLHVVLDNYGTHKLPMVREWLERNPWVHLNFTAPKAAAKCAIVPIQAG